MNKHGTRFVLAAVLIAALAFAAIGFRYWKQSCNRAKLYELITKGDESHKRGNDRQAADCFLQAANLAQKMRDDIWLGRSLNDLGQVYISEGKYIRARDALKRALAVRKRSLGEWNYQTAIAMRNLSNVCDDLGRYGEAESLLLNAMEIAKATRGVNHPNAESFTNDLGIIKLHRRDYRGVEEQFNKALDIARHQKDQKAISTYLGNLSYACTLQGRFVDAESDARQALSLAEKSCGPMHLNTLIARSNLGRALTGLNKYYFTIPVLHSKVAHSA